MKPITFFFNILVVFGLLACYPTTKVVTPSREMVMEKPFFPQTDTFLTGLLGQYPQYFDSFLQQPDRWRIQIIYTQINRDKANRPSFTHYYFNADPNSYFYPASTVKMPVALLALQKLNELAATGITRNSTMITEVGGEGQTGVANDPTTEDGRPTVAHYLKKIFLVSDNDAYNRLYEFLGQEYINQNLHRLGYDSAQIIHRLSIPLSEEQNRITNPVRFYDTAGHFLYGQPQQRSRLAYQPRNTALGRGYRSGGQTIFQPFDFSQKNRLTLHDLHSILSSVIFPEATPRKQRFNLTADDYRLVYRHMSMVPGESAFPSYDSSYPDAYVKFLLLGGEGKMENKGLRIFNKVGNAYGFLTDAAYIVDFDKGVEFLLSATIYCNSNGIFNDDQYDYQKVGLPFMRHLGKVIYEHELARPRKNLPDLSAFKFDYAP